MLRHSSIPTRYIDTRAAGGIAELLFHFFSLSMREKKIKATDSDIVAWSQGLLQANQAAWLLTTTFGNL